MGLTQNLGRLSPSIFSDASLNIGVGAAPSGSYKFEVTGTSKVSGVLTLGATISNGTYTYTLPGATGTLALTSALSGYLPLSGGTLTGALIGTTANFSGKVGINATIAAWVSGFSVIQMGALASFWNSDVNYSGIGNNIYYNGTFYKYLTTSFANKFEIGNGTFTWEGAPSGTAGDNVTFTEYMRLDTNGNLGLRTTTIGSRLQINGNAAIGYSASTAAPTNGLAVNGSVGIGTNTPSGSLEIAKAGGLFLRLNNTSSSADAYIQYDVVGSSFSIGVNGDGWFSYTGGTKKYDWWIANVVRMSLSTSGNLLLGSNPTDNGSKLQVSGAATFSSSVTASGGYLGGGANITTIGTANNSPTTPSVNFGVLNSIYAFIDLSTQAVEGSWIDFSKGNGSDFSGRIRYENSSDSFQFFTNGSTERMRITSGGAINIVDSYFLANSSFGYRFNNQADSFNNFIISDNGNASLRGTLTQNASDERLKNNIQVIPNAIDKILQLRGVTFEWNQEIYETSRTNDIGVIAQDVQSVLSDAVTLAPFDTNFEDMTSKSGENYLTVYYEKLIPLLIEGIKEQQTQIEELKLLINK